MSESPQGIIHCTRGTNDHDTSADEGTNKHYDDDDGDHELKIYAHS